MMLSLCSSPPECGIAAAEIPAESKALIKLTLSYSRLVVIYPMLFSCQKSSALEGVPPGWVGAVVSGRLSVVRKNLKTNFQTVICPKFGAKRPALVTGTEIYGGRY